MTPVELSNKLIDNIEKMIVGKRDKAELVVTALPAGGNVLLEDVPGTGKTMLARSLAASVGVDFKRIQFTPDLLPADLTGITYFDPKTSDFTFRKGAVFTNVLLADEINRATPRTQSALLEAMEEKQITIDGTTYILHDPFFVIATQNPVETHGTYPLPEAQLDRFMIKTGMGYPETEEYISLIETHGAGNALSSLTAVCTAEDIKSAKEQCEKIYLHKDLAAYIVNLAEKTRTAESVLLGLSTRGILAAVRMSRALAAVRGRGFVTPDDIKYIFPYIACHRLILSGGYKHKAGRAEEIISGILSSQPVPSENWSA